jgi:hypothetical protein
MQEYPSDKDDSKFPDGREISAFVATLASEGERVAVIISAARIDYVLEGILKGLMVPHTGPSDPLFDSERPLGSFSAKISLSYRIGLIDSELEAAITIIRKIRNDFSHSMRPEHLGDSPHRERVNELVKNLKTSPFYEAIYSGLAPHIAPAHFCAFCTGVAVVLSSLRVLEKLRAQPIGSRMLIPRQGLLKDF